MGFKSGIQNQIYFGRNGNVKTNKQTNDFIEKGTKNL